MVARGLRRCLAVSACLVVAAAAIQVAAASAGSGPRAPTAVKVVRTYLRALAAHDASGVCGTFSPQLKRFLRRWEPGRGCQRRVATAHFSIASPGYQVKHVAVVRVTRVTRDASGGLGVHLRLRYRYPCMFVGGPIPGCRPHVEIRSDVIYLGVSHGRWRIVKPGEIYVQTSLNGAPGVFDAFTPPGDASTVKRPARLPRSEVSCPTTGPSATNPQPTLQPESANGRSLPFSAAPWLGITFVHAAWLARDQLCMAINLAGAPRPDSTYSIDVSQGVHGGQLISLYGITIDGVGQVQTQLSDPPDSFKRGQAPCPTSAGLNGNQLVLIASPGNRDFDLARSLMIDGFSLSLQTSEPLLTHPIDAGDVVPGSYGLKIKPASGAGALHRCLPL